MFNKNDARWVMTCLKACQYEDKPVSQVFTQLLRYTLLHCDAIKHVHVIQDPRDQHFGDLASFSHLPLFLQSQADIQNIADNSSLWLQIQPILTFVDNNLAQEEDLPSIPTIFTSHLEDTHRTYFFFAFLEVKMRSKSYSAGELLRIRHASVKDKIGHRIRAVVREDPGLS